jgi:tetratricopeptide (TPR) repeat protein
LTDVGARLEGVFARHAPSVLAEAQRDSFDQLVHGAPPGVVRARGRVLASRVRDWLAAQGRTREATAVTRGLLRSYIDESGHEHPDALTELGALGALLWRAGKREEGAKLLQGAYEALRSVAGGRDIRVASVAGNYALALVHEQDWLAAEHVLETALRIRREHAPTTTGMVAAQLGEVRVRQGKLELARAAMREAWEQYSQQHGRAHARTLARARVYGKLLLRLELFDSAVEVLRDVYEGTAPNTAAWADAAFDLGVVLDTVGQREEGLRQVEEAVRWTRAAGDDELAHPTLADRSSQYARMLMRRGRLGEVEGLLLEALEADRRRLGDASEAVAHRHVTLGNYYANNGRVQEAMGWLEPGTSLLRSTLGDADIHTKRAASQLVTLLLHEAKAAAGRRDPELVRALLQRAWMVAVPILGFGDTRTRQLRELGAKVGLRL